MSDYRHLGIHVERPDPPPAQPQPEPPMPQPPPPSSAWGGPDTYRPALPTEEWDRAARERFLVAAYDAVNRRHQERLGEQIDPIAWDETPAGDLSWLGLLACLASALLMIWLIASGYWLAALGFVVGLIVGWEPSARGWMRFGVGVALMLLVALIAAIVRGGWW